MTFVTAMLVYFAMDNNIRSDLHSVVGPTIMTAILAYFTGKMITSVYGMAVTTILQCFVADEELFPQSERFAQNDLRSWMDRHGAPVEVHSNPGKPRTSAQEHSFS